jgi:hypothetical protein
MKEKSEIKLLVERVNLPPAPVQQTVLCRLSAIWPSIEQTPFGAIEFQPIPETGR